MGGGDPLFLFSTLETPLLPFTGNDMKLPSPLSALHNANELKEIMVSSERAMPAHLHIALPHQTQNIQKGISKEVAAAASKA